MTFRAVRADKTDVGQVVKLVDMDESEFMDGDVTIRVTHSTVNYKDGLALSGKSAVTVGFPWCSASISLESWRVRAGRTSRQATRLS